VIDSAGGTGSTMVEFTEVAGEGENGELLAECSLAVGTHYEITAPLPGDYPVAIVAGDPVMVTVEGTDPDDGSSPTDTLTCTYTDSANSDPGMTVTYPLVLDVGGGSARFQVSKAFTDGYDDDVLVRITCDDGLPLQNDKVISPGNPVTFVVTDFEAGAMNCTVTEGDAAGYLATYSAGGDSQSVDDNLDAPGCHFIGVGSGDENTCAVTNTPAPVDVRINKQWFIDGAVGDDVIPFAELTLFCDSPIVDGQHEYGDMPVDQELFINGGNWYKEFEGIGDQTYTAQVIPKRPSTRCWVVEGDQPSGVETENGCKNIVVSVGNGDTCTITNTVFFEGIPTLSQYGLALMALLMLGMGMVGFRRFA
jgi:hypothetical protein